MTDEQRTIRGDSQTLFKGSSCLEMARPDTLDPIIWAAGFIWAGMVLLACSFGYLEVQAWSLFFLGAGVLVLIELAVRLLIPVHRRDLLGTLIWAGVLLGLGTGNWSLILSLALIAIGTSILLRGFFRSLRSI